MKKEVAQDLAKFFYDCGKVTFAFLMVGSFARKPFSFFDLIVGVASTLLLVTLAVNIGNWEVE